MLLGIPCNFQTLITFLDEIRHVYGNSFPVENLFHFADRTCYPVVPKLRVRVNCLDTFVPQRVPTLGM